MARTVPVSGITPEILKWARETAHLSVDDVSKRLKKEPEDITSWETGHTSPTYGQLERLAYELYNRPIAIFFLPEPPDEPKPEAEFRSLPYADLENLNRDTVLLIRKARCYQESLRELFGEKSPADRPLWASIQLDVSGSAREQAAILRRELDVPIVGANDWGGSSGEAALKTWRKTVEERGIFVFKNSFKQREISGFCLEDPEFPIMLLNNSTTKTRQIFSLLHELMHILLGRRSISTFDPGALSGLPADERKIEQFCNKVASEVLVPHDDFSRQLSMEPGNLSNWDDYQFERLAARYRVSREVILRRLLDQKKVSQEVYRSKKLEWDAQVESGQGSGGNFYLTTRSYLSERLMGEVFSRYQRRLISLNEAASLIGVKPKHVAGLESRFLEGFAS